MKYSYLGGICAVVVFAIGGIATYTINMKTPAATEETQETPGLENMKLATDTISGEEMVAGPKRKDRVQATTATSSSATATTTPISLLVTPAGRYTGKTMAWIYPGKPACSAATEIADGRNIHTLKAEYFTINGGSLKRIDATTYCNGYSAAHVALLKQHSTEQYVTISSASAVDMANFLATAEQRQKAVAELVTFVDANGLTGIELDFEDFGGWNASSYANYKLFVTELGTALRSKSKKLMIDGPAVSNQTEENWYVWRYADFVSLPVDYMVVMTYDYQFDHGAGEPVSPLDWMKKSLEFVSQRFPKERLVAGISSYGYMGTVGSYRPTILTAEQLRQKPGFASATRDARSAELTWRDGTTVYFYSDRDSINAKAAVAKELGIPAISVWHLGGNHWF